MENKNFQVFDFKTGGLGIHLSLVSGSSCACLKSVI